MKSPEGPEGVARLKHNDRGGVEEATVEVPAWVVVAVVVLLVIIIAAKSVLVIPQAQSGVIERLGRFRAVAEPGLNFLVPFLDRVRAKIDLREQVVSFPPQPVITQD